MDGDGQIQRRSRKAPMPSFPGRLRPVSLRLCLDPEETRSIFREQRPCRPCLPQTPCDSR